MSSLKPASTSKPSSWVGESPVAASSVAGFAVRVVVGELAFAPVVELLLALLLLLLLVPCFLSAFLAWLAAGGSWLVVGLVRGLRVDRVVGGEEVVVCARFFLRNARASPPFIALWP